MKEAIDEFMWGFQQHFRYGVARDCERALAKLGLHVKARVLLVGIAAGDAQPHAICVEPEDGPLRSDALTGVTARAERVLEADPERAVIVTDPRHRVLRERALIDGSIRTALIDTIAESGAYPDLQFFGSSSSPVNGYDVFTLVGLPTRELAALPALDGEMVERVTVSRSLQHEVIDQCLRRASSALYQPDAGAGLYPLNASAEEIVLSAAVRFVDSLAFRLTGTPADLYHAINAFSRLGYERTSAVGRRLVVSGSADQDLTVRFREPIRLGNARIMRKLLELSDENQAVVTDGRFAVGLGHREPSEHAAEVTFNGQGAWQLCIDQECLIQVDQGEASLPGSPIGRHRFSDIASRILGDGVAEDLIWGAIQAAQQSGHGMTLVISAEPAEEARRLEGQLVPIDPIHITSTTIARLGRVDGAILVGADGLCHAFGVILDGTAGDSGDPARGSRYNSAVGYQRSASSPALVVVVSDDQSLDLLPNLRPRMHRAVVRAAVDQFVSICGRSVVDGELFGEAHDDVMRLAFYLTQDQCDLVTAAYKAEMDRRLAGGGMKLSAPLLRPDPEMDDSYFFPCEPNE